MILFVCDNDWANHQHNCANSLRSIGVKVTDVKTVKHGFSYPSQSDVKGRSEVNRLITKASTIVVFHSCGQSYHYVKHYKKKSARVFVFHTGNFYRKHSVYCDNIFKGVDGVLTNHTEFMKGGTPMKYVERPVNEGDYPSFMHGVNDPLKFAHYPSNPDVKGTKKIVEMMQGYDFDYSDKPIAHKENMKRVSNCDVYIELFAPKIDETYEYGHWGYSALEAAACGKVVVTQNLNVGKYEEVYGKPPFCLANDEGDFKGIISALSKMNKLEISNIQTETNRWVEEKHSYKATGERLKQVLCL